MSRRIALVAIAAAIAGCGGTKLREQASTIDEMISRARASGAERCAPVELAMAESHNDFARQELDEGNYYRAQEEVAIAQQNARLALDRSPADRCADRPVAAAPAPKPSDRDGDGILDADDECPDRPEDPDGFQDDDGCPDDDNDNDGLADAVDECKNDPEDRDNFEDDDGCPDDDNDKDGLADTIDQCPSEPEDVDGHEDDDGCPDCDNDGDGVLECPQVVDKCPDQPARTPDGCPQKYKLVVVTESKIELSQTVYFNTGKATIRAVSHALLDEVAQALQDHPDIRVRIEGHTDSRGKDRYNLRLSQARAESVREYLVRRGVDESRMVAKGYGETMPIADNRTSGGREQNRRVEFVITSR